MICTCFDSGDAKGTFPVIYLAKVNDYTEHSISSKTKFSSNHFVCFVALDQHFQLKRDRDREIRDHSTKAVSMEGPGSNLGDIHGKAVHYPGSWLAGP